MKVCCALRCAALRWPADGGDAGGAPEWTGAPVWAGGAVPLTRALAVSGRGAAGHLTTRNHALHTHTHTPGQHTCPNRRSPSSPPPLRQRPPQRVRRPLPPRARTARWAAAAARGPRRTPACWMVPPSMRSTTSLGRCRSPTRACGPRGLRVRRRARGGACVLRMACGMPEGRALGHGTGLSGAALLVLLLACCRRRQGPAAAQVCVIRHAAADHNAAAAAAGQQGRQRHSAWWRRCCAAGCSSPGSRRCRCSRCS
jgi:hypothetical protein